ncbi:MAG: hypothetical protein JW706_11595 [Opitutales bacterium]|nr:hypothetical protein [Opitutales bacterium]
MNIDGLETTLIESMKSTFLAPKQDTPVKAPTQEEVRVETEKLAQMAQRVQEMPENRPEVVERGIELLNDPNYPSADVEEQLAAILLGFEEERF